ncbi:adhesion G protein-coupled receptor L3-like [Littorina saxatilis]|uniref:adhesion G protein-coupled receptor L3-like n=1 Tax=Littorina saxatilis TaxID=31220 RepID=UPI0038B51A46
MNTGPTRSETTPSSTDTTGLTQTDTFTQPYTSSTGQGLTTIVTTDTNATGPMYNYTTLQTPTNTTISNITSILPQNNSTSPSPTNTTISNITSILPQNNSTSPSPTNTTISNITSILPQNNSTSPSPTNTTISNITSILPQNNSTSPSPTNTTISNITSILPQNNSTSPSPTNTTISNITSILPQHNSTSPSPTNTTISNITSILPQHNSTSPSPTTIDVGNHTSTSFNYTTERTTTSWDNLTTSMPSSSTTRNRITTTSQPTSVVTAVTFETTVHGALYCPADGVWPQTSANVTRIIPCPKDYLPGHLYRRCKKTGSWEIVDSDNCTRTELHLLKKKVEQIQQGNISYNDTKDVLKKLVNETENSLTQGDVKAVVDIMDALANIASQKHPPDEEYLGNFVNITENVFNASADIWSSDTTLANRVLHAVEVIGVAAATNPSLNLSHVPVIATENIALKIGRSSGNEGIGFPDRSNAGLLKSWIQQSSTSAFLSVEAIPGNMTPVPYSAVLYRDLSQVLQVQPGTLVLNSAVLSFSLPTVNITEPIRLTFQHLKDALNSSLAPSCRFFQFGSDSKTGKWSTQGCTLVTTNDSVTVCQCDHLTNFAILMGRLESNKALETLSGIGCGISICCLIITLIVYRVCWRYLRSDRNVILANLYVTLVLAYVTLLVGADHTSPRAGCTVVAVLLHYLWLAVFCLMLCEGLDLFFSIIIVFPRARSILPWLLLMAYGAPVIIVAISMGTTQLEGYGGQTNCWLSIQDGLVWAFSAPALAIILANYIIAAIVIRVLLKSKARTSANWSWRQKTKSVVRSVCVMSPILGLTWVFGVLGSDPSSWQVFQWLFIFFNSLQGFFIFILHCVMSKQVRDGISNLRRQYEASKTSGSSSRDYLPPSFDVAIHSGHYRMRSNGSSENQMPTTDDSELGAHNIAMLNFDSLSETASKHKIV